MVEDVLLYATSSHDELCISCGSFYTITYLIEGYLKKDKQLQGQRKIKELREILNGILDSFHIIGSSDGAMRRGVNDKKFSDLEDSYQAQISEANSCDVLLTINKKHFEKFSMSSSVLVMTPKEFLEAYRD